MHFSFVCNKILLFEGKKHGEDDQDKRNDVVPAKSLGLENRDDDDGEHGQWDGFLYDFQLDKIERASVLHRSDAVGGYHEGILEQGNAPRHEDDKKERPVLWTGDYLEQFELSIPGKCHENIGNDK